MKKIAIVGAGPTGIYTLFSLLQQQTPLSISIFEQADEAGVGMPYSDEENSKMMLANKRLGLEKWNNLLWAFLVNVLGFPKAYLPGVEMASTAGPLLDIVWKGGNFGLHAERSLPASASVFSRKMHTPPG